MMHGPSFYSALGYTWGAYAGLDDLLPFHTLPIQLAQRGYDVWVAGFRGLTHSNVNERDGEWSLEERWDFTWADQGFYDLPALVEKVLQVTAKPKLTLTGYSQGSSAMFYGLAQK